MWTSLPLTLALWTGVLGAGTLWAAGAAAETSSTRGDQEASQATSSTAARQSAVRSLPLEKLDAESRAKVDSVLGNVTVFRRFPVRVVSCDPDLYLFTIRHPDVVVDTWRVLGISQLQCRQTGTDTYRVAESAGTSAVMEFLYHTHDVQIVYGEWGYTGPLLPRTVHGRCLAILKSGYVRETDGRYYITSRLDGFLSIEPGGAELLTKVLHPLVVKNADANFVQTLAFVGSMSRTAEVNPRGMQRLADRLTGVQPDVRQQLAQVVAGVAQRAAARGNNDSKAPHVAGRPEKKE
jgi:hypothetical protein